MLSAKHPPARNLLDLADAKQVRTLTRRLKLSADELNQIIQKSGTSIAAIESLFRRWEPIISSRCLEDPTRIRTMRAGRRNLTETFESTVVLSNDRSTPSKLDNFICHHEL
jgi:hypothetical protein